MWCYACSWDVRGELTLNSMAHIHTSVTLLTSRDLTWSSGWLTCQHASHISAVAHILWDVRSRDKCWAAGWWAFYDTLVYKLIYGFAMLLRCYHSVEKHGTWLTHSDIRHSMFRKQRCKELIIWIVRYILNSKQNINKCWHMLYWFNYSLLLLGELLHC
jgi:hypothetical protein